jgi:cytochrome b6-f complex iron-sulfur subunit
MSVEEMLAAARQQDSGEQAAPAESAPETAPEESAPAAEESAPAATAAAGLRDSGSLLGTRKENRPGPMTNEQARDVGRETPELKPEKSVKEVVVVPPMPEKPAYALSEEPEKKTGRDRRSFFSTVGGVLFGSSLAIGFTSLAVTQLLWLLGLARFMFPNVLIERPTLFKVGFPDDFAPGQVATKFKAQFGIWVVRYEYDGTAQIYALKTVCTHLGCTPNWLEGEQKFKCPCHGSGFYKDGINFEGPAPRPLERYAIQLADDGQLEVDKSRKFNEELGQWADPASYVNV